MEKKIFCQFGEYVIVFLFFVLPFSSRFVEPMKLMSFNGPEFTSPIKNISVHVGTNVEFSCNILNLGDYRLMWLKLEDGKEQLMAVNNLKVSKNPRVSVSLLPGSEGITQSILYIETVEAQDDGNYHCLINTSPITVQIGTLEVKEEPPAAATMAPTTITTSPTETATTIPPGSEDGVVIETTNQPSKPCGETSSNGDIGRESFRQIVNFVRESIHYLLTVTFRTTKSLL